MAAGKLFGIARAASEYARRRMSKSVQQADVIVAATTPKAEQTSLARRLSQFVFGRGRKQKGEPQQGPPLPPGSDQVEQRPGAPPRQPGQPLPPGSPPPTPPRPPVGMPGGEEFDEIELLGRDASYHRGDWTAVMAGLRMTPGSTNVFGYYFEFESRTQGILYVTFLAVTVGGRRAGPGQTYAYYDVPGRKYHQFASATDASAGGAVWDYLRIRGTIAGHQHNYRLVQSHGDYVPRKATPRGYRDRTVTQVGQTGRREYRRSTLPERLFAQPNRGTPNRGTPDRGDQ